MKLVQEFKKELEKLGITNFDDFDFFEDENTISLELKQNGYNTYGDSKTNIWAIEETLKEYAKIYA